MDENTIICTGCPMGCYLRITETQDGITVEGNKCPRGYEIAMAEMSGGTWIFTSVVATTSGRIVPVRSTSQVPVSLSGEIVEKLKEIRVPDDVPQGFVVIKDITPGVDIVLQRPAWYEWP